jgi:hypothetical protein
MVDVLRREKEELKKGMMTEDEVMNLRKKHGALNHH